MSRGRGIAVAGVGSDDIEIRETSLQDHLASLDRAVDRLEQAQAHIVRLIDNLEGIYPIAVEPGLASTGGANGDLADQVLNRQRGGIGLVRQAMANVRLVWANIREVDDAAYRRLQAIENRLDVGERWLNALEADRARRG